MNLRCIILALSFLATCYKRGNPNIINFIRERYGPNDLKPKNISHNGASKNADQ